MRIKSENRGWGWIMCGESRAENRVLSGALSVAAISR